MGGNANQQRFEALWREHRGIVLKVASVYAHGAQERLDLVQEIGAQLWRSFASFDERRAKFSTWLYRIALNVAISQLRRAGGEAGRFEPLDRVHLETLAGEPAAEPDERLAALYAFIDEFDAFNRALILLYLEDKSYAEIADVLGIGISNVATKINRIKTRLRDRMTAAVTTGA